MNKIMIVGRIVRDPTTETTQSGIKYSRFTIAVNRPFGDEQADFVPIVAWRSQAEFIENYMTKGALVSIEGRFTSSSYTNSENQPVTRYEVTADRVEALESKAVSEARKGNTQEVVLSKNPSASSTQTMEFAKENKPAEETKPVVEDKPDDKDLKNVPWDLDL